MVTDLHEHTDSRAAHTHTHTQNAVCRQKVRTVTSQAQPHSEVQFTFMVFVMDCFLYRDAGFSVVQESVVKMTITNSQFLCFLYDMLTKGNLFQPVLNRPTSQIWTSLWPVCRPFNRTSLPAFVLWTHNSSIVIIFTYVFSTTHTSYHMLTFSLSSSQSSPSPDHLEPSHRRHHRRHHPPTLSSPSSSSLYWCDTPSVLLSFCSSTLFSSLSMSL